MSKQRKTAIDIEKEQFRQVGYQLIDAIANLLDGIEKRPVTPGQSPKTLQDILGSSLLPADGEGVEKIVSTSSELLMEHSLFNGHPKFMGYITSSPAPIGMLADLLASSVNPNVGAQILSPMATEIEKQTVKWLAELIGVSTEYGGVLVSGGNMANFTAFVAARTHKAPKELKEAGLGSIAQEMVFYCSKATHTWIEKAAVLFGHGTRAIRWISVDEDNRMNIPMLKKQIHDDVAQGKMPFMVIGNAGDVSRGTVDDLSAIAAVCKAHDLWFHIDGAYGIPAAAIPELKDMFAGIQEADSIALDPHKWLYAPLEAGCTLVKNPQHLINTYSSHPAYYNFGSREEQPPVNFYEYGFQNSRGFRALKVWMALRQAGKNGYVKMIHEDIELSVLMFKKAKQHPELEAMTQSLSITTLRYVPESGLDEPYLNELNEKLLNKLQQGGDAFLSNALVNDRYCLRACIVNFRTSPADIEQTIDVIVREGRALHTSMRG